MRDHIYSILLYLRSINFFIKFLLNELNKDDFVIDTKIQIIVNSILFLLNKIVIFVELILNFFKLLLKEGVILMDVTDDTKSINSEYKENFVAITIILKSLMKKINTLFNFDLDFHFKMVKITRFDNNESKIVLSFNENYINEIKKCYFLNIGERVNLLDTIFDEANELKTVLTNLFSSILNKLDDEVKIFKSQSLENRIKKEDNCYLLKIKSDQIENNRKELFDNLEKVYGLLPKINRILKLTSWELRKYKDSSIYHNLLSDKTINR